MSTTYPDWGLTTYPDAPDKTNTNIRQDIINFEDRVASDDISYYLKYHVLANDVRSLQHAVFALEEVLGTTPQTTFETVNARITDLEDYTDLDIRYGGAGWGAIPDLQKPTILSHIHDGSAQGAPKIDLGDNVTGSLQTVNLNLDRANGGLTGEDIALNSSTDQTIAEKFSDKYDKAGGAISGPVTVAGLFNSKVYTETDAKLCVPSSGATGANVADAESFTGIARRGASTDATGNLIYYTSQLRYGDYSLGLRMKVTDKTSLQSVGKIKIYSGSVLAAQSDIIPSKFGLANDYQMVYVSFTHKVTGGVPNTNIKVYVEWYGTSVIPAINCNLNIDSVIITPMHIAVYDKPTI